MTTKQPAEAAETIELDNLSKALDALWAEAGQEVEKDGLPAYMARIDQVIEAARAIRATHVKAWHVIQSTESKARSKARIAEAMKLLEAKEAAEKKTEEVK